jgi:hypothetical protein
MNWILTVSPNIFFKDNRDIRIVLKLGVSRQHDGSGFMANIPKFSIELSIDEIVWSIETPKE